MGAIKMYGTPSCGDCRRAKQVFQAEGMEYEWIDNSGNSEAVALVEKINGGYRSVPTIVFPDGAVLVEPPSPALTQKLRSLKQRASRVSCMDSYSEEQFEELIVEALAGLPAEFQEKLDNISVEVKDWPSRRDLIRAGLPPGRTLLALYHGIPLTQRDQGYNLVMPDRITLYLGPIVEAGRTPEGIRRQIRRTVLHEIAHHFGISDERLRELGAY